MEYKCLSDFLFKGENKNINISVSKNSPVNASLSLDGYKHSMVQIIASYLNISNVNDIECDSGYIFNYTLYNSFVKDKIDFKIILPEELKEQKIRFLNKDVFFTNIKVH